MMALEQLAFATDLVSSQNNDAPQKSPFFKEMVETIPLLIFNDVKDFPDGSSIEMQFDNTGHFPFGFFPPSKNSFLRSQLVFTAYANKRDRNSPFYVYWYHYMLNGTAFFNYRFLDRGNGKARTNVYVPVMEADIEAAFCFWRSFRNE